MATERQLSSWPVSHQLVFTFLTSFLKRALKPALFYQKDLSRQHNYSQKEYNKHNQGKVLGYIINNLYFQVVELCSAMFLDSAIRNSHSFFLLLIVHLNIGPLY